MFGLVYWTTGLVIGSTVVLPLTVALTVKVGVSVIRLPSLMADRPIDVCPAFSRTETVVPAAFRVNVGGWLTGVMTIERNAELMPLIAAPSLTVNCTLRFTGVRKPLLGKLLLLK